MADQGSSSAGQPTVDVCRVASVPISKILSADSPRLAGESSEHVRMLAESEAELPPIVVHQPTMRVIDGMHRLRAALLRGAETIDVQFIDDADGPDLFVLAVEANTAHGLPLTLADRQAAAERIVISHPQWSDRAIAKVTRLAAKTVRAIRERAAGDIPQLPGRIGQDGKMRPLNGAEGRMLAGEILRANPRASLRQVASEAGVSLGTAFDVRKRLMCGEELVPTRRRDGHASQRASGAMEGPDTDGNREPSQDKSRVRRRRGGALAGPKAVQDPAEILSMLMKDPALRYTESGRNLVRRLSSLGAGILRWEDKVDVVPPHCTRTVADYARRVAESWDEFAEQLEQRERAARTQPTTR
ncbi:ParB/RepB/Spo0J family partition protein [Streptomyces sp. NPDC051658]|uniref:ParB/RepB/Spo0J family partition protein n=1 Tax=Streptomyces sp. NPDC051658 TaxID=3365667 RepID=UPI0037B48649